MALKHLFRGRLIAIGGNEDKVDELVVLRRVVQEVGKTEYKVGVITTASEEPEQRGQYYHRVLTTLGASSIEILNITTRAQANDSTLTKTPEPVMSQIKERYRQVVTLIKSELMKEIISIRVDGLWKMLSQNKTAFSQNYMKKGPLENWTKKAPYLFLIDISTY